jgi:hypothetical protein
MNLFLCSCARGGRIAFGLCSQILDIVGTQPALISRTKEFLLLVLVLRRPAAAVRGITQCPDFEMTTLDYSPTITMRVIWCRGLTDH